MNDWDDPPANQRRTFAWEGDYDRPWESLEESTTGRLTLKDDGESAFSKRRKTNPLATASIKRRMLRSVLVVMDASKASLMNDWKPTRLIAATNAVMNFAKAFYDENPLSSMGLVCVRKGKAERLSGFTKNPKEIERALSGLQAGGAAEGAATLQNALNWAIEMFKHVPDYVEREVIFVASAISVVDPGDVFLSIKQLKEKPVVRCSTIHLCGLVEVYNRLATQTSGTFAVARDPRHLQDLLNEHITPPPSNKMSGAMHMVQMGFPSQKLDESFSSAQPAFCLDVQEVVRAPYYCPRCRSSVASLPATCGVCALNLISSSHLARSYHHLFPVETFVDLPAEESISTVCTACQEKKPPILASSVIFFASCPKCKKPFCRLCDELIHDTLFLCPGCV